MKWKLVKTENETYLCAETEHGKRFLSMPFVVTRKARKLGNTQLNLFSYRAKKADMKLSILRWYFCTPDQKEVPSIVAALDGKKLKITIEVVE